MRDTVKVLFVCIGNHCRSQMAEGFVRYYGTNRVEARSAGTAALGTVNDIAIEVMAQERIDISSQTSDQLTDEMIQWADMVVTLGCCSADELCPVTYIGAKIDWPVDDPFGRPAAVFRRVRDDIKERVQGLIDGCA